MDGVGQPDPLRVLFVNRMAGLERGGGETFDLEISRHLARAGVRISYLSGAPLWGPAPMPIEGATVTVDIRGKAFPYVVVKPPFYKRT